MKTFTLVSFLKIRLLTSITYYEKNHVSFWDNTSGFFLRKGTDDREKSVGNGAKVGNPAFGQ